VGRASLLPVRYFELGRYCSGPPGRGLWVGRLGRLGLRCLPAPAAGRGAAGSEKKARARGRGQDRDRGLPMRLAVEICSLLGRNNVTAH
jgi:hypothetical protein